MLHVRNELNRVLQKLSENRQHDNLENVLFLLMKINRHMQSWKLGHVEQKKNLYILFYKTQSFAQK